MAPQVIAPTLANDTDAPSNKATTNQAAPLGAPAMSIHTGLFDKDSPQ